MTMLAAGNQGLMWCSVWMVATVIAARATSVEACSIEVRAPPELADTIANGLRTERACTPGLQASVVPDATGFSVRARAGLRHWERHVTDAETASALVMSWAIPDEAAPLAASSPSVRLDAVAPSHVVVELAASAVVTSNIDETSSSRFGAGLAASGDAGRSWWRIGIAGLIVRGVDGHQRAIANAHAIAIYRAAQWAISGRVGLGEQARVATLPTPDGPVGLVGLAVRVRLASQVAITLDTSLYAPFHEALRQAELVPMISVGVEVSL